MINLLLQIAIIVALTLLNGFFAMSETALVSSRKERFSQRAEAGARGAAETGLLDRCRVVGDPRVLPAVAQWRIEVRDREAHGGRLSRPEGGPSPPHASLLPVPPRLPDGRDRSDRLAG